MTNRERMLATLRGEATDEIPWAPRMDLWYISLLARGDLPARFEGLDMVGVADELGVSCHSLAADYTLERTPEDLILGGLGLAAHPDYPFRFELRDLEVEFERDAENLMTTFHTPAGSTTTHLYHTDQMMREGISAAHVRSHAIRSADDFEIVAQIFEHLEVVPTPQSHAAYRERVGDRGLAVAFGLESASPLHLIMHDLVSPQQFYYLYADDLPAMLELGERMAPFFDSILDALAPCEAEAVLWGSNYDRSLTWPPFFKEHITPWLRRASARMHEAGKLLVTHCDGENNGLLPLYPACGFDAAESVCPHPMTECTLAEIRAALGSDTTVWGGIPSVALIPEAMAATTFEAYLDDLFGALGKGDHLILGVADNVPPDADLSRMERIKDRVREFGPVDP